MSPKQPKNVPLSEVQNPSMTTRTFPQGFPQNVVQKALESRLMLNEAPTLNQSNGP